MEHPKSLGGESTERKQVESPVRDELSQPVAMDSIRCSMKGVAEG